MNKCIKCGHSVSPRLLVCSNVSYCQRRVQAQRQEAEEVLVVEHLYGLTPEEYGAAKAEEQEQVDAMVAKIQETVGPFVFEADIEAQETDWEDKFFAEDDEEAREMNDMEAQEMGFANDEVRKINEELGFIEPRKDG